MNAHERTSVAKAWLALAQMYGRQIPEASLKIMIDAVQDLEFEPVLKFLKNWPRVAKVERHPYPREIHEGVLPAVVDTKLLATSIARKIDKALIAHGYTWEQGFFSPHGRFWEAFVDGKRERFRSFKDAVLAELGPLAWAAICERGGWGEVTASQKAMEEGQFIAQMRDQVQAVWSLSQAGVDVTQLQMPSPLRQQDDGLIRGNFRKFLTGGSDEPA